MNDYDEILIRTGNEFLVRFKDKFYYVKLPNNIEYIKKVAVKYDKEGEQIGVSSDAIYETDIDEYDDISDEAIMDCIMYNADEIENFGRIKEVNEKTVKRMLNNKSDVDGYKLSSEEDLEENFGSTSAYPMGANIDRTMFTARHDMYEDDVESYQPSLYQIAQTELKRDYEKVTDRMILNKLHNDYNNATPNIETYYTIAEKELKRDYDDVTHDMIVNKLENEYGVNYHDAVN